MMPRLSALLPEDDPEPLLDDDALPGEADEDRPLEDRPLEDRPLDDSPLETGELL